MEDGLFDALYEDLSTEEEYDVDELTENEDFAHDGYFDNIEGHEIL